MNQSLKLARVAMLLDSNNEELWKQYFLSTVGMIDVNYLFSCNMFKKDVLKVFPQSVFREMLYYWAQNNYHSPDTVNEILQQNLWFNSHIKKANRWLFHKQLFLAGIKRLIDIYNLDEARCYTYQEFIELCENVDFVTYYGICASIPKLWMNTLRQNQPSPLPKQSWPQTFELLTQGKPSSNIYNFLRDKAASDNSSLLILWNNDLRLDLQLKEFDRLFVKIRKLTVSTKLRYFQYRILVRALTMNIRVAKWDSSVSPMCTFCNGFLETTVHMFAQCEIVQKKIWNPLKKWFQYM